MGTPFIILVVFCKSKTILKEKVYFKKNQIAFVKHSVLLASTLTIFQPWLPFM